MARNLQDFYSDIRLALGRGTSLDAQIPRKTANAARWLERNFSMKYMERYGTVTVLADSDFPDTITLPNCWVKSVLYIRFTDGTSPYRKYRYLKKVKPQEVANPDSRFFNSEAVRVPTQYMQVGRNVLKLNAAVLADTTFEIFWYQYTDWPTNEEDGCAPWLVTDADDILMAQTMIFFSAQLRDPRLRDVYTQQRDEGLKTLSMADDEADELGQANVMEYS